MNTTKYDFLTAFKLEKQIEEVNNEFKKVLNKLSLGVQTQDMLGNPSVIEDRLIKSGLNENEAREILIEFVKTDYIVALGYIKHYEQSFNTSKEIDLKIWMIAFDCLRKHPIPLFRLLQRYLEHDKQWKQAKIKIVPDGVVEELYQNYSHVLFDYCTNERSDFFKDYCSLFLNFMGDLEKDYIIKKLKHQRKPNYDMIEFVLKKYEHDLPEHLLGKISAQIVEKRLFENVF